MEATEQNAELTVVDSGTVQTGEKPSRAFADGSLICERYRVERLLGLGGFGEVYQVASVARGPNALADQVLSQARGMREFAFARAVCRTRRESVPLAVALVDARASELQFFGYLYPEELHCEGLGPLLRRAELSR